MDAIAKTYTLRKLKRIDRRGLQKMMCTFRPIIHPPTFGVNFYLIDELRSFSLKGEVDIRAVLDTNVISRLLKLADSTQVLVPEIDKETRLVCGIMAFLTYSGIEIVPELAFCEKQTPKGPSQKREQDYILRIIDHMSPQSLADIWSGKYNQLPEADYLAAKKAVDTNPLTQSDIELHSYDDEFQPGVLNAYSNMLYAWILYKTEPGAEQRLAKYLDWSLNSSLGSQQLILFVITFLSEQRYGSMIKNVNTNDPKVLLKNVMNVSWDIFHLGSVEQLIEDSHRKMTWCFVTRDKLLLKIGQEIYSVVDLASLDLYLCKYFSKNGQKIVQRHLQQYNNRKNRDSHVRKVVNTLDEQILTLESHVMSILN